MKRCLVAFVVACSVMINAARAAGPTQITIGVKGMVCSFCAQGIKKTISRHKGVHSVNVDLDKKLVTVFMNGDDEFSDNEIRETIVDSGFEVVSIERANVAQLPESK